MFKIENGLVARKFYCDTVCPTKQESRVKDNLRH